MTRIILLCLLTFSASAQPFHVLAFYTAQHDLAHISFVEEANVRFPEMGKANGFTYEATSDWSRLNETEVRKYDVLLFLDTRPEDPNVRAAFEAYMKSGGAWMGFHFSAFAMDGTDYNIDWKWYHETFLGSGEFVSNTWRPTSAVLRVEDRRHPAVSSLPDAFRSQPNEWYRWKNDLRKNPDIDILLAIDASSFPLGTGPKPHEIWHDGYYPVVWTNRNYRMLYVNMGHNDMDYEGGTNASLSSTFGNPEQDKFFVDALLWLAGRKKT